MRAMARRLSLHQAADFGLAPGMIASCGERRGQDRADRTAQTWKLVAAACLRPGFATFLLVGSPSSRGERSAERRRGLRSPMSRCERPDTLAKRVRVPLRSGTLAFRRSTTVFVRPCLTRSRPRLPPGSQPATGGPAGSLRTGHSAHRAVSEASRESGRLRAGRAGTPSLPLPNGNHPDGAPQQAG